MSTPVPIKTSNNNHSSFPVNDPGKDGPIQTTAQKISKVVILNGVLDGVKGAFLGNYLVCGSLGGGGTALGIAALVGAVSFVTGGIAAIVLLSVFGGYVAYTAIKGGYEAYKNEKSAQEQEAPGFVLDEQGTTNSFCSVLLSFTDRDYDLDDQDDLDGPVVLPEFIGEEAARGSQYGDGTK